MTLLFLYGGYGVYVPPTTGYINLHTRVPDYALVVRMLDVIATTTYESMDRVIPGGEVRVIPGGEERVLVYDDQVFTFRTSVSMPRTQLTVLGKNLSAGTIITEEQRVIPGGEVRVIPGGEERQVNYDTAARLPAMHISARDYNFVVRSPE